MGKKILLVEGQDDEHVLKHLFGKRHLPNDFEIAKHGGCDHLLEVIPTRLKESDIETVGIVLDADTNLESRWEAVRNRVLSAGYPSVPSKPDPLGLVLSPPPGISKPLPWSR